MKVPVIVIIMDNICNTDNMNGVLGPNGAHVIDLAEVEQCIVDGNAIQAEVSNILKDACDIFDPTEELEQSEFRILSWT